jgi:hypothetical protein
MPLKGYSEDIRADITALTPTSLPIPLASPGWALSGLGEDRVIARMLLVGLAAASRQVAENLQALARLGMFGTYGLYEAAISRLLACPS